MLLFVATETWKNPEKNRATYVCRHRKPGQYDGSFERRRDMPKVKKRIKMRPVLFDINVSDIDLGLSLSLRLGFATVWQKK